MDITSYGQQTLREYKKMYGIKHPFTKEVMLIAPTPEGVCKILGITLKTDPDERFVQEQDIRAAWFEFVQKSPEKAFTALLRLNPD